MDRRLFLRRTALALPALVVGDAALEAFERLTHRKVFALGGVDSAYLSGLFRPGEGVALIRSGAIVEFGVVADRYTVTMNYPVSVQSDDLLIHANHVEPGVMGWTSNDGRAARAHRSPLGRVTHTNAWTS